MRTNPKINVKYPPCRIILTGVKDLKTYILGIRIQNICIFAKH